MEYFPDICKLYISVVLTWILVTSSGNPLRQAIQDEPQRFKRESTVCPKGRYLDTVTGHCDPCTPYCYRASEKPPKGCRTFCGQMISTVGPVNIRKDTIGGRRNCAVGYYFDPGTSNCDPCLPYCMSPHEEPPGGCQTFCASLAQTSTISQQTEPSKTGEKPLLSAAAIAIVAISVIIILIVIVGIGMVVLHRRRDQRHTINLEAKNNAELQPFKIGGTPEETAHRETSSKMVINTSSV